MEIAHRGYAAEAPENTIAALRRAGRRADAVEIDVRRCGSGELVVLHDAEVDRLTDETGRASELSLSDLRALDVLGSGESIPTLADALAVVPPDVAVNAELKETGIAADAVDALAAVENRAIVSSFSRQALREARAASASVPTAYLAKRLRDRPVTSAVELECQYVHPRYTLCLRSPLVARAHELGLGVNAWTVERPLVGRCCVVSASTASSPIGAAWSPPDIAGRPTLGERIGATYSRERRRSGANAAGSPALPVRSITRRNSAAGQ